jgi:hypothetical protein
MFSPSENPLQAKIAALGEPFWTPELFRIGEKIRFSRIFGLIPFGKFKVKKSKDK